MNQIPGVPSGFTKLEVYEAYFKGDLLVILGEPSEDHSCDEMGCGSVSNHTIAYAQLQGRDWPDPLIKELVELRDIARNDLPRSILGPGQVERLNSIARKLTQLIENL